MSGCLCEPRYDDDGSACFHSDRYLKHAREIAEGSNYLPVGTEDIYARYSKYESRIPQCKGDNFKSPQLILASLSVASLNFRVLLPCCVLLHVSPRASGLVPDDYHLIKLSFASARL